MAETLDHLHRQTQRVAKRLARHTNPDASVDGEKLHLSALDKVALPPEVNAAHDDLVSLFPRTGLPELLTEVNRWTGFTKALTHLARRRPPIGGARSGDTARDTGGLGRGGDELRSGDTGEFVGNSRA